MPARFACAEQLVIISPHWEGFRYEFARAFSQWYGKPVEVDWRDLGGANDDLKFVEGKEDELLGRMQQRLGKNKEELRREISEL